MLLICVILESNCDFHVIIYLVWSLFAPAASSDGGVPVVADSASACGSVFCRDKKC